MKYSTSNTRITSSSAVITPYALIKKYPLTDSSAEFIYKARNKVKNILNGEDNNLVIVVGPCSIHDDKAAREYAAKLLAIKKELEHNLFIIMRVYFEKPRTTIGWKGLINDPDLDGSFNINKGLKIARCLLLDLTAMGMPVAVECLDLITPQYISDLISWGAIGARTTESQSHRELASALSFPVGFKNGTSGSIKIAIDAVKSANNRHHLLSINHHGNVGHHISSGNNTTHVVLRGGNNSHTNYGQEHIRAIVKRLKAEKLQHRVMVDFSHDNSQKQFKNQLIVGRDVAAQIRTNSSDIFGVMIESNLNEGKQDIGPLNSLKYGVSITDACIGWDDTEKLLRVLSAATQQRNS